MKKNDLILIGFLVVLALIIYSIVYLLSPNATNQKAEIRVEGQQIETFDLSQNGVFEFSFGDNKGQIEISNNRVRILPMSKSICPKSICSDTGWISFQYQIIVCLPNAISINIISNETPKIDSISS